ncbi:MAG TPA: LuxR C-terminal-related transcriptional regulator [Oscillospiraceae bacterium]|nr:LuxR C-terminal-related transcriptional regulator [Oscillospiraceae bacterium]
MKKFDNQRQSQNQRYHPLRRENDKDSVDLIPVTEEQYQVLMRDINRTRKREQRAGRCFCPKKYFFKCDGACDICQYHRNDTVSLESPISDDDESLTLADTLVSDTDIAAELEEEERRKAANLAISHLSDRDQKIVRLFMDGLSERDISQWVDCSQKTVNNRKKAIFAELLDKLVDWF